MESCSYKLSTLQEFWRLIQQRLVTRRLKKIHARSVGICSCICAEPVMIDYNSSLDVCKEARWNLCMQIAKEQRPVVPQHGRARLLILLAFPSPVYKHHSYVETSRASRYLSQHIKPITPPEKVVPSRPHYRSKVSRP